MRFARGDLRDHIISYQNDHRPSYWPQRALRQQERLKIDLREIFGVVRFSTFATISARSGQSTIDRLFGQAISPSEETTTLRVARSQLNLPSRQSSIRRI